MANTGGPKITVTRTRTDGTAIDPNLQEGFGSVVAAIEELRQSLLDELPRTIGSVLNAEIASAGGGGEGGVAGADRSLAEQIRYAEQAERVARARFGEIFNVSKTIETIWQDLMKYQVREMATMHDRFVDFSAVLMSGKAALEDFNNAVRQGTQAAKSGLGSTIDILANHLNFFDTAAVSLIGSISDIRENIDAGGSAYTLFGDNIKMFGQDLQQLRDGITDVRMSEALDRSGQNQMLMGIYEEMLKQGRTDALNTQQLNIEATKQFKLFDIIARNTGRTVEELIKLRPETQADVTEMIARGRMTAEQGRTALALSKIVEATPALAGLADGLNGMIKYLGDGGVNAYLAANPDAAQDLVKTGQLEVLRFLEQQLLTGRLNEENVLDVLGEAGRRWQEFLSQTGPLHRLIDQNNTFSLANALAEMQEKSDTRGNRFFEWLLNEFNEMFLDNPFINSIKYVAGLLGSAAHLLILKTHTMAMIAHTAALQKASLGKGLGWMAEMFSGGARRLGSAAGKAAGFVARWGARALAIGAAGASTGGIALALFLAWEVVDLLTGGFLSDLAGKAINFVMDQLGKLYDRIKTFDYGGWFDGQMQEIKDLWDNIVQGFWTAFDGITGYLADSASWIWDQVKEVTGWEPWSNPIQAAVPEITVAAPSQTTGSIAIDKSIIDALHQLQDHQTINRGMTDDQLIQLMRQDRGVFEDVVRVLKQIAHNTGRFKITESGG